MRWLQNYLNLNSCFPLPLESSTSFFPETFFFEFLIIPYSQHQKITMPLFQGFLSERVFLSEIGCTGFGRTSSIEFVSRVCWPPGRPPRTESDLTQELLAWVARGGSLVSCLVLQFRQWSTSTARDRLSSRAAVDIEI